MHRFVALAEFVKEVLDVLLHGQALELLQGQIQHALGDEATGQVTDRLALPAVIAAGDLEARDRQVVLIQTHGQPPELEAHLGRVALGQALLIEGHQVARDLFVLGLVAVCLLHGVAGFLLAVHARQQTAALQMGKGIARVFLKDLVERRQRDLGLLGIDPQNIGQVAARVTQAPIENKRVHQIPAQLERLGRSLGESLHLRDGFAHAVGGHRKHVLQDLNDVIPRLARGIGAGRRQMMFDLQGLQLDGAIVSRDGPIVREPAAAIERGQGAHGFAIVGVGGQHRFVVSDGRFHLIGILGGRGHQLAQLGVFGLLRFQLAPQFDRFLRHLQGQIATHQMQADIDPLGMPLVDRFEKLRDLAIDPALAQVNGGKVILDGGVVGLVDQRLAIDGLGLVFDDPLAAIGVGQLQHQLAAAAAHGQQRLDGADGQVVVALLTRDLGQVGQDGFILRMVNKRFLENGAGLGVVAPFLDKAVADGYQDFGGFGVGFQRLGEDLHGRLVHPVLGGVASPQQAQAHRVTRIELQDLLSVLHRFLALAGLQQPGGDDDVRRRRGGVHLQ